MRAASSAPGRPLQGLRLFLICAADARTGPACALHLAGDARVGPVCVAGPAWASGAACASRAACPCGPRQCCTLVHACVTPACTETPSLCAIAVRAGRRRAGLAGRGCGGQRKDGLDRAAGQSSGVRRGRVGRHVRDHALGIHVPGLHAAPARAHQPARQRGQGHETLRERSVRDQALVAHTDLASPYPHRAGPTPDIQHLGHAMRRRSGAARARAHRILSARASHASAVTGAPVSSTAARAASASGSEAGAQMRTTPGRIDIASNSTIDRLQPGNTIPQAFALFQAPGLELQA